MMSHQMQLDLQRPMIMSRAGIRDKLVLTNRRSGLMMGLKQSLPERYSKGQKFPNGKKGMRVEMKGDHKSMKGNMASLMRVLPSNNT